MYFLNKLKEDIRLEYGIITQEEVSKITFKGQLYSLRLMTK